MAIVVRVATRHVSVTVGVGLPGAIFLDKGQRHTTSALRSHVFKTVRLRKRPYDLSAALVAHPVGHNVTLEVAKGPYVPVTAHGARNGTEVTLDPPSRSEEHTPELQ